MKYILILLALLTTTSSLTAQYNQHKITYTNDKTETVTIVSYYNNSFKIVTKKDVFKSVELEKVKKITFVEDEEHEDEYPYELETNQGDIYDCKIIKFYKNTFTILTDDDEELKLSKSKIQQLEMLDSDRFTEGLVMQSGALAESFNTIGLHFEFGNAKMNDDYYTDGMQVGFSRISLSYTSGNPIFLWGFRASFIQGKNNIGLYYPEGNGNVNSYAFDLGKRKIQSLELGVLLRLNLLKKAIIPFISATPSFSYSSDPLQHYRDVDINYITNTPIYNSSSYYEPSEYRIGGNLNLQAGLSYLLKNKLLIDASVGYQIFYWQRTYLEKFNGISFGAGASYVF